MRLALAIVILATSAPAAWAGSCRYYSRGTDHVEECDNGYLAVRHRDGSREEYGERNGGFVKYPGMNYQNYMRRRAE